MGLYGVIFGLIIILIHLAGLQSFGVPYLTPLVHGTADDMVKTLIRPPWWLYTFRPRLLNLQQQRRQAMNIWAPTTPLEERELAHEQTAEQDAGEG